MRKLLAVCAAFVVLSLAVPAAAHNEGPGEVAHCAPGLVHYMPLCLTAAEFEALLKPPPPPVAPGPRNVDVVEQWRPLVTKYWPPALVEWALRIIRCESRGLWWAKNPSSTAAGLFQFLRSTWDRGPAPALGFPSYASGAPYDPEMNIAAAAWLYANWGGPGQWSCKA